MSESIYGWIKEVPPPPTKPPMYHSKVNPHTPLLASTFGETAKKKPTGVMGRPDVKDSVKPTEYLKAHDKTGFAPDGTEIPSKFNRTEAVPRKPAVPRKDEAPVHGLTSGRNFVVSNAVDAILAVPKHKAGPRPEEIDWTKRPGFGSVPDYLESIKRDIEAEHDYVQSLLDQQRMEEEIAAGQGVRELGMDERADLIAALKAKWDQVNHAYQKITWKKISPATASVGEIRWKEQCETQLSQLEKDIDRLSVQAPIFVVDENAAAAAATSSPRTGGSAGFKPSASAGGGSVRGGGSGATLGARGSTASGSVVSGSSRR